MNLHGVLNKGQGRRRVERQVAMLAAIGVAMLGGIAVATNAQADPQPKAWVCKYVGTPYVNETLKTGNDGLVWVDTGTTQGQYFGDSQNDSYVLLVGPHDPEPAASGCPAPRGPIVTVTSEHATSCTEYSVRDVTTTIGWVEVDGQWVQGTPVITYGDWVNSVPTAGQLEAAGLDCTIRLIDVTPEASATLGSCTAAGHVTLGDNRGYSWSENTGTANGPTYTAKANAGYKLIGTGVFTFHGLSQLPSTSPACLAPPRPVVAGVVENAPVVVAGVVETAPVVAGVVKNAPAVKSLAFTGAETVPLGLSGLLTLVLGAVLTVASRRQRPKQARE
jgi:hypothetical protein